MTQLSNVMEIWCELWTIDIENILRIYNLSSNSKSHILDNYKWSNVVLEQRGVVKAVAQIYWLTNTNFYDIQTSYI